MTTTPELILASRSERRRNILRQLGLNFQQDFDSIDETPLPGENPHDFTLRMAKSKAEIIGLRYPHAMIVAADTIVTIDGLILGKPIDDGDACAMLQRLSGHLHQVITGLCLWHPARNFQVAHNAVTEVLFASLSAKEIEAYVASREPMDKAGAYGIQEKGALWVKEIHGCFYNVMGFPIRLFYELWRESMPRNPLSEIFSGENH